MILNNKKKGQISLEFLIIILVMISILVLFMPLFVKIYNATLLSLDVYNAKVFVSDFSTKVENLNILENESYFNISIKPIGNYIIICENYKINIKSFIKKDINMQSTIESDLALDCDYEITINKKINLKITKESDKKIIIEKN